MSVRAATLALAACGASDREASAPAPATITLDWQMRRDGDQLRIDYTIKNATAARITVVDALAGSNKDAIVVHAATEPDAIAFTRAFVPPAQGFKPYHQPSPHYRDLAAGGELRGTAHTGVPLVPWHNFTGSWAITGTRSKAVLEIGYYDQQSVDAKNAKTAPRVGPDAFKLLRSAPKPLPAGVALATPEQQVALSNGGVVMPPSP